MTGFFVSVTTSHKKGGTMAITRDHCLTGQLYHLSFRVSEDLGACSLVANASDAFKLISSIDESLNFSRTLCHSFCLLKKELHMLITPKAKQSVLSFGEQLSLRLENVFRGRARHPALTLTEHGLSLVDDECYALTLSRYIESLPVLRGDAQRASDYSYSSYQNNAVKACLWGERWLRPHMTYYELGLTESERRKRYRALFCIGIPKSTIKQIQYANQHYRVVGDDLFKRRLERRLARSLDREAKALAV